MLEIITGDLLLSDAKYIAHQTNAITNTTAHGLAYYLFKKYPYADCYADRKEVSTLGTIDIRGNGKDQRFVINMCAQYYPGPVLKTFEDHPLHGTKAREKAFHKCLLKIAKIENIETIAFPYLTGCGLAKGNWDHYYQMINNFAKYIYEKQNAKTFIVQRERDI